MNDSTQIPNQKRSLRPLAVGLRLRCRKGFHFGRGVFTVVAGHLSFVRSTQYSTAP